MRTKTEVTIERPRDEVFRRFVDEMATQKNPAKTHRRSMIRLVLIGWALAALLGMAFATYQALTA